MDLQTLLAGFLDFLTGTIIPFLLVIATLMFVWNGIRYFVIGGANEEAQESARSLALWGILAFVFIVSLWGIVTLFSDAIGGSNSGTLLPDYMCEKNANGECNNLLPTPREIVPIPDNDRFLPGTQT